MSQDLNFSMEKFSAKLLETGPSFENFSIRHVF